MLDVHPSSHVVSCNRPRKWRNKCCKTKQLKHRWNGSPSCNLGKENFGNSHGTPLRFFLHMVFLYFFEVFFVVSFPWKATRSSDNTLPSTLSTVAKRLRSDLEKNVTFRTSRDSLPVTGRFVSTGCTSRALEGVARSPSVRNWCHGHKPQRNVADNLWRTSAWLKNRWYQMNSNQHTGILFFSVF